MEPRLLRHGNKVPAEAERLALLKVGFNGATSSQTWKSKKGNLQAVIGNNEASMEPRLLRHGNPCT